MEQQQPTTFEEERDDLLALYDGSPVFRRAGDYTPDQFEGRCRTYLPKLKALLQKYVQAYPHFREVLGLELSRPRRSKSVNGFTAYEFDGLMLPERLTQRVGRLKLPAGAMMFPALNPLYKSDNGAAALQQRNHYQWALKIAGQIASATTRDLLTFIQSSQRTSLVVSALQRLRAFGPDEQQLESAVGKSNGLERWWERCGLQLSRAEIRATTRSDHEVAFDDCFQHSIPELTRAVAAQLVADAAAAKQMGQCSHGFSPSFYWHYFTRTVIPFEHHLPEIRVYAAVVVLYQLADYDGKEQERVQKPVKAEVLRVIEELTSEKAPASQYLADVFFIQLSRQLEGMSTSERLKRHLSISRLSRQPSLIYSFYQAVGTYLDVQDIEENEWADCLLDLAQAIDSNAQLRPGRDELAACASSICLELYTGLDLSKPDQQYMLQRLYALLAHCLPPVEKDTLKELILEQLAEQPTSADQWLAGDGTLAQELRQQLRRQLSTELISIGSQEYERCSQLLVTYTPPSEVRLNHRLFAYRYDVSYFLTL